MVPRVTPTVLKNRNLALFFLVLSEEKLQQALRLPVSLQKLLSVSGLSHPRDCSILTPACVNAIRKRDPYFTVKFQHRVHLHALGNLQEGAANPALLPPSVPAAHRTPLQRVPAQTDEGRRVAGKHSYVTSHGLEHGETGLTAAFCFVWLNCLLLI